ADNATVAAVAVQDGLGIEGGVQVAGSVTVEDAAVSVTVGGWFGKTVGSRALRCPAKNWKPNPCGSVDSWKPAGKFRSWKMRSPCWFRCMRYHALNPSQRRGKTRTPPRKSMGLFGNAFGVRPPT